ncbi:RNA 2',3'-cyclic phosphodiesterase [Kribbia dieselivorans]|uniref:RNA 2',3'-cyclic phosphodiesterase n=1 Tax=Kribbia dieselivorans TaxID=331526 RepID=UPI000838615D|nr:RNA 2',3'-cyclic phosphodiesterase [Kribbia dieselivorans]
MGQRMFVAIRPPEQVVDELTDFLEPRPGMPWTSPEQWHLTLAFLANVPEHRTDELVDELAMHVVSHQAFEMRLAGGGVFPHAIGASVLWLGVSNGPAGDGVTERLSALATTTRNVANSVGATPDGKGFVPHLTIARLRRPIEATKWLRILDTFTSSPWTVDQIEVIASHLGERKGRRPRYETLATLRLG